MPQQGMPQQGMPQQGMPQQGFMPQRIGYNLGGIDRPFEGIGALNPRMGYALGEQVTEEITETPENIQMASYDEHYDKYGYQDFLQYQQGGGDLPWTQWYNDIYMPMLDKKFGIDFAQGGRVGLYAGTQKKKKKKAGSKAPGPHKKTDLELLKEEHPTLFSDTTTSIEGSPKKKKYTKGKAQGGRIGYQGGSDSSGDPQYEENLVEWPEGSGDFWEIDKLRDLLGLDIKAQGGRIGFNSGGETEYENWLIDNYDLLVTDLSWEEHLKKSKEWKDSKAQGGRIGYQEGTFPAEKLYWDLFLKYFHIDKMDADAAADKAVKEFRKYNAQGGRIGAQGGGIMPLLDMGGMEKDYRQEGGFVPIGRKEKADDVPARLSKNEFVFTADAVKAAGGGDIDEGAQRMYNVMKNLEAGGEISEQSQGQG